MGRAGEQHDRASVGVEQLEQAGDLLDERVVAAGVEEAPVPVADGPLEEVLAAGGVGQHAVDVEHDAATARTSGAPSRQRQLSGLLPVSSVLLAAPCWRRRLISSTTAASARVVVSPRSRPSATSRRSRRMILPLRVLGRSSVKMIVFGRAMAPIFVATCSRSSSPCSAVGSTPPFSVTKAMIAWPVVSSLAPTTAASATVGWSTSADSTSVVEMRWPDDVHHVVDPAEQPEVAVVVELGAVAGEVAAVEPAPVRLAVALGVAVDAAQHRRPRPGEREVAAAALDRLARVVDHLGADAGQRERGRARLERGDARAAG